MSTLAWDCWGDLKAAFDRAFPGRGRAYRIEFSTTDEGEPYADLFGRGGRWALGVIERTTEGWKVILRTDNDRGFSAMPFGTAEGITDWLAEAA